MGYAVEAGIFTAEEVGAPHKRARLFILAIPADAKSERSGEAWRFFNRPQKWVAGSGEELANSVSDGTRADTCDIGCQGQTNEGEVEREEWDGLFGERSGGYVGDGGTAGDGLAVSRCEGLAERKEQSTRKEFPAAERSGNLMAHPNVRRQQQWINTGMGRMPQPFPPGAVGDAASLGQREQADKVNAEPKERGTWIESSSAGDRWPAGPGQEQYAWECSRTIEPGMGSAINGYNFREDILRALGNGVVEQTAELAFRTLLEKHFS